MTTKNFTREQISAFADGELDDNQFDAMMAALKTPEGREAWTGYHEIGDVLRSDDMAVVMSPDFTSRLMSRLDDEPTVVAPVAPVPVHNARQAVGLHAVAAFGKKRFAFAGMAAAAVAALAFVVVPQAMVGTTAVDGVGATASAAMAKASVEQEAVAAMASSAVSGHAEVMRSADVDEYLLAHQRFSPSVYSTAQYARSATFAVDSEK
jgi:sigma-E factor negative regulatory protein RseA